MKDTIWVIFHKRFFLNVNLSSLRIPIITVIHVFINNLSLSLRITLQSFTRFWSKHLLMHFPSSCLELQSGNCISQVLIRLILNILNFLFRNINILILTDHFKDFLNAFFSWWVKIEHYYSTIFFHHYLFAKDFVKKRKCFLLRIT